MSMFALLRKLLFRRQNCTCCGRNIKCRVHGPYHGGFGGTGTAYCDLCGRSLHYNWNDPVSTRIAPKAPWEMSANEHERVEQYFVRCPCGGRFRFQAPPRCPECRCSLSEMLGSDTSMYLRIEPSIDQERGDRVWGNDVYHSA